MLLCGPCGAPRIMFPVRAVCELYVVPVDDTTDKRRSWPSWRKFERDRDGRVCDEWEDDGRMGGLGEPVEEVSGKGTGEGGSEEVDAPRLTVLWWGLLDGLPKKAGLGGCSGSITADGEDDELSAVVASSVCMLDFR